MPKAKILLMKNMRLRLTILVSLVGMRCKAKDHIRILGIGLELACN